MHYSDQYCLRPGYFLPFVVPVTSRRFHLLSDPRTHAGVLQPLEEFGIAALVCPGRNESGKGVEPGGVGVRIGCDIHPVTPRLFDVRDDLRHTAPVLFTGSFQMPDLNRYAGVAPDSSRLINGRDYGIAFAAHMCSVNAAERSDLPRECDQLLGGG